MLTIILTTREAGRLTFSALHLNVAVLLSGLVIWLPVKQISKSAGTFLCLTNGANLSASFGGSLSMKCSSMGASESASSMAFRSGFCILYFLIVFFIVATFYFEVWVGVCTISNSSDAWQQGRQEQPDRPPDASCRVRVSGPVQQAQASGRH